MQYLFVLAAVLFSVPANATPFVINNGLAPPDPANVIDDATHSGDQVYVRNVGCPPGWPAVSPDDPCPSPGAATEVGLVNGGEVEDLYALDSSRITMSDGNVWEYLTLRDSSTLTMSGGTVTNNIFAHAFSAVTLNGASAVCVNSYDSSAVTLNSGTVTILDANDSSAVTINGGSVSDLRFNDTSTLTLGEEVGTLGDLRAYDSFSTALNDVDVGALSTYHSAVVTLSGGSATRLSGYGSSAMVTDNTSVSGNLTSYADATVDMSRGSVGGYIVASNSSAITLDGTPVSGYLSISDDATVDVSGGSVGDYVTADGASAATLDGTAVSGDLRCYENATIDMRGGSVGGVVRAYGSSVVLSDAELWGYLVSNGDSSVVIKGTSSVYEELYALDFSSVAITGGSGASQLAAYDSSRITVIGSSDFAVDGIPVPYGDLVPVTGRLTGTLASGDSLDNVFYQGGYGGSFTGTITLAPPTACSDYADNDADGFIDYPDDPGCRDATSVREDPQCQDGVNNDRGQDPNPGLIDFDGGQSIWGLCTGVACVPPDTWPACGCPPGVSDPDGDGVANPDPQCVGKPWKNAERKPSGTCGLGAELALLLPPLMWVWRRRRGG